MASASLHSSSSAHEVQYDVFLSFRGDTRKGITSELHSQLTKRGIETFIDTDLQVGDVISPALLKAIEESRFAIVILSQNYASSTGCLQEIAKICRCMENNDRILPLFFNVEPNDVLLLKGSFEEAFTNYENSGLYRSEKLQEWKDALKKVANCKGWNSKNYKTERELVQKIVEDMCSIVQPLEKNKGDLEEFEAKREAMNKAHAVSGVNVSGGRILECNINFGTHGDVVTGVGGDFIKNIRWNFFKDVKEYSINHINMGKQGDFVTGVRGDIIKDGRGDIKGGPSGDIIIGDKGGNGGDSYNGAFAGAPTTAKGNNTFNYGIDNQ